MSERARARTSEPAKVSRDARRDGFAFQPRGFAVQAKDADVPATERVGELWEKYLRLRGAGIGESPSVFSDHPGARVVQPKLEPDALNDMIRPPGRIALPRPPIVEPARVSNAPSQVLQLTKMADLGSDPTDEEIRSTDEYESYVSEAVEEIGRVLSDEEALAACRVYSANPEMPMVDAALQVVGKQEATGVDIGDAKESKESKGESDVPAGAIALATQIEAGNFEKRKMKLTGKNKARVIVINGTNAVHKWRQHTGHELGEVAKSPMTEYYVKPFVSGEEDDGQRLVVDDDGVFYYSDHYADFIRFTV